MAVPYEIREAVEKEDSTVQFYELLLVPSDSPDDFSGCMTLIFH